MIGLAFTFSDEAEVDRCHLRPIGLAGRLGRPIGPAGSNGSRAGLQKDIEDEELENSVKIKGRKLLACGARGLYSDGFFVDAFRV